MLNLYVLMIQGTSGIKNVWVKCNSWTLYIYFAQICPNKELAFHVHTNHIEAVRSDVCGYLYFGTLIVHHRRRTWYVAARGTARQCVCYASAPNCRHAHTLHNNKPHPICTTSLVATQTALANAYIYINTQANINTRDNIYIYIYKCEQRASKSKAIARTTFWAATRAAC